MINKWFRRPGFFVLLFAIILHMLWGAALLMSPVTLFTTPMAFLITLVGQKLAGIVLLTVAVLAALGMRHPGVGGLVLGSFQNFVLWLSAGSALVAIINGMYPDGVDRSPWFIFADQLLIILFATMHACSLSFYHRKGLEIADVADPSSSKSY